MLIQTVEFRQQGRVFRTDLRNRLIHHLSPNRGAVLDEIQVIRTEEDRVDGLRELRSCFPDAVDGDSLGLSGTYPDSDALFPLMAEDLSQDLRLGKVKTDQLAVKSRPETLSAGQQIHRFQEIGLPLGIFSRNHIGAGGEVRGLPFVIAKSVQRDLMNDHCSEP